MTESIHQGQTNPAETTDTAEWRWEANRQRGVALYLAAEFQRKKMARRAKEHNDALCRIEKRAIPVEVEPPVETTTLEESPAESTITERSSVKSPVKSEAWADQETSTPVAWAIQDEEEGRGIRLFHSRSCAWCELPTYASLTKLQVVMSPNLETWLNLRKSVTHITPKNEIESRKRQV
ncbi:unnamed protein product [Phytophthora fragariaefolia]|uniref:Unnamed protein product n=1 Tax=Phytophthora fragariaefolia TaxID=1490495 RepID=A0A9W6TLJ3_9STRA|nr:unnamed protein product [Phytophthora fragariaefolia]